MMHYKDLRLDQSRQISDTKDAFERYDEDFAESRRFVGSMRWKTIDGKDYLYHKRRSIEKSVGRRNAETQEVYARFYAGKQEIGERLIRRAGRLDELAPVNRALDIARAPSIVGRVLREFAHEGLLGGPMMVVGTNALFAYERAAGVQIGSEMMTTEDVDILYDNRARLRFLSEKPLRSVIGILRQADKSFRPIKAHSYRAANDDGFMVDIVTPNPKDRLRAQKLRIGDDPDDMQAAEIDGLVWLVNCPKLSEVVLDDRGYPFRMVCPDPRGYAIHKLWLSKRPDRDRTKALRDRAQADVVARLVFAKLPHLRFDAPDLQAIPNDLREAAAALATGQPEASATPNW